MTSRSLRGLPVCFCNWIYLVTNFKFFSLLLIVHFVCLVLIHFVTVVVVSEINLFDLKKKKKIDKSGPIRHPLSFSLQHFELAELHWHTSRVTPSFFCGEVHLLRLAAMVLGRERQMV